MTFAIFNEDSYLSNYPDVEAAVDAGVFISGREHFEKYGLAEGRVLVSPFYDEQFYLRANPDVEAAVRGGGFSSGLQHYIENGEAEGRSAGAFDEQAYLELNPDVAAAVEAGGFSSGLQHYIQYGQFEESRIGFFFGTTGDDTINAFGKITNITGIDVEDIAITEDGRIDIQSNTLGAGEVDTLIGGTGRDLFILGTANSPAGFQSFNYYVGSGSDDYALIQEFEVGSDAITLPGSTLTDYSFNSNNGNFNISTLSGDLIAIVEGVTFLSQVPGTGLDGTFQLA